MSKDKSRNNSLRQRLGGFFGRKSSPASNQKTDSTGSSSLSIDYSLSNVEAAEWALRNAGATYDNITQEEHEAIRQAVATFVQLRGFTVGKVIQLLSKHFDKERAEVIAITEITRAYAHAAQIKGEKTLREFRDVKVVKIWSTNNDELVCDTCKALNGKAVGILKPFAVGIFLPPAHAGCRCWIGSTTDITNTYET